MNATAESVFIEAAGNCPVATEATDPICSADLEQPPAESQPLVIVPDGPGMEVVRPAYVLRMSQILREPQFHTMLQGERCLPPEQSLSLQARCSLPQAGCGLPPERCVWPHGWLWPQRIAVGKVTVLVGENGLGKSSIAADLAARVSRGSPWPERSTAVPGENCGNAPKGTALVVCAAEEQVGLLPARLEGAGADLDQVCTIQMEWFEDDSVNPPGQQPRSILERLELVRAALQKLPDCKLVVIDSLSVFLDGPQARRSGVVQLALQKLAKLARKFGVAMVVVSHLNGPASMRSFSQFMATLGPPSIGRSVWGVLRDPEDAERQLMVSLDGNFAKTAEAMSFRLALKPSPCGRGQGEGAGILMQHHHADFQHPHPNPEFTNPGPEGEGEMLPHVEWGTAASTSLWQVLRANSGFRISEQKYRDTENYVQARLREVLSGGPIRQTEITREIKASEDQIYRGADTLGVVRKKKSFLEGWIWMLPEHYPQWQAEHEQTRETNEAARERRKNERKKLKRAERRQAREMAEREMQKAEFEMQKAESRRQNVSEPAAISKPSPLGRGQGEGATEAAERIARMKAEGGSHPLHPHPGAEFPNPGPEGEGVVLKPDSPLQVPLGKRDLSDSPESVSEKKDLPPAQVAEPQPLSEEQKEYNRKFHEQVRLEREERRIIHETAMRWLPQPAPDDDEPEEISAEEEARLCWVDDDGNEIEESGAGVRDGPG